MPNEPIGLSRRLMLGFTGAAALSGLPAPVLASAAEPDAELIALCAKFHVLNAAVMDTNNTPDDTDAAWEDVLEERWDISDEIEDIAPVTLAGHRAKVAVALALLTENYGPNGGQEGAALRFAYAALGNFTGSVAA